MYLVYYTEVVAVVLGKAARKQIKKFIRTKQLICFCVWRALSSNYIYAKEYDVARVLRCTGLDAITKKNTTRYMQSHVCRILLTNQKGRVRYVGRAVEVSSYQHSYYDTGGCGTMGTTPRDTPMTYLSQCFVLYSPSMNSICRKQESIYSHPRSSVSNRFSKY